MIRPQFKRNGEIDRQLDDLVKASSWKQAVALCERRIKKGDKSDAASIAKAHVLQACPDVVRQQQGTKELERLISRDPPILDVEVLRSVHRFAVFRKGPRDQLGTPWIRAAKARPHDEKIIKAWFETVFDTRHYRDAQEAAIMYKIRFPHNHQAHYWYIITCQLLAESNESEDVVRKVNQGLVYGNLAKAAKALTSAGVLPTNGLVLENLEDLLLLLRVYRSQDRFQEALNILDDDRAGIFSRIGNKAWQLVRHKVELLELSGQWQELWQFCQKVLSGSHPQALLQNSTSTNSAFGRMGDDWAIWSRLVIAANQICTEDTFSQAEACIDSFAVFSRNARIARLKLYASYPIEGADIKSKLFIACQEHFTDFSTKYVCFLDLSPYLPSLRAEHITELNDFAAQHTRSLTPGPNDPETKAVQWITSEVNLLKLNYNMYVSKLPANVARPLLDFFVCRCLRLYKLSLAMDAGLPISERRTGDDAAILAAMTLVHIWDLGKEEIALIRCVAILETLVLGSPHNYDALLILIRLCVNVGTPSLAMNHYLQLSVKNMQNATLSWILYTRISMLHPYPYVSQSKNHKAVNVINIPENITAALEWHAGAVKLSSYSVCKMLREGQYNMLFDALTLENPLRVGFSRLLLLVEWSRIQRLTGVSSDVDCSNFLDDASGKVEDNRDRKVFPNYEWQSHSPFESRLEHNASEDILWLSYQLQIVNAWDILDGSEHINGEFLRNICEADPLSIDHLPVLEKAMISTLYCGVQILASYQSGQKTESSRKHIMRGLEHLASSQEMAGEVLTNSSDFEKLSTHLRPGLKTPNASYLQHYFGIFDVCHAIRRCVSCVMNLNEENKIVEPASLLRLSLRLVDGNRAIAVKAEQQASTMQSGLRGERALNETVAAVFDGHHQRQDLVGEELQKTIGQPNMERIAECLRDSWIEALDGTVKAARYLGSKSDL